MKFLRKLLVILLIVLLLAATALYFLLQTRWGAGQIGNWVNENTGYHLSFDKLEHRWSSPDHLVFKNLTFGRSGQSPALVAQSVDIDLSTRQFSEPLYADAILLQKGTLNISDPAIPLPFRAGRLQLSEMAINHPEGPWRLNAQRVNGGVSPWVPEAGRFLGNKADIQFSAGSITLNDLQASRVLLQGSLNGQQIVLRNVGADIARGALTGSARRNDDGSWQIGSLRLSDIRLQTALSLVEFLTPAAALPALQVDSLEVTDARIEGAAWAVTDVNLSLRNIALNQGRWRSKDGKLSMNASEFVNGTLHLQDPIVNIDLTQRGATLRQFSSRWEKGVVRASGEWLRESQQAVMDEITIAGLEYTLPGNWQTLWMQRLPGWLAGLTVKKLSASRNLLIDINPDWPFQITALDGTARNIELVRHHQWGIWSGEAALNAAAATFNRVDLRRPSIALNANQNRIAITELSAFSGQGLLEATATLSQLPQRELTLEMKGKSVPINLLQQWGWPALTLEGDGNLQLSASARLAAGQTLKPTVNARLQATSASGQQILQTMYNGDVLEATAPGTE